MLETFALLVGTAVVGCAPPPAPAAWPAGEIVDLSHSYDEQTIPAFENLTALDRLPARGAIVIALPMKIGGGSGVPLRAVAVLPEPR